MQFENSSSEIIDNDIQALNPLNDMPFTMTELVTRSNALREKRKIEKQRNNHNTNVNRSNNQYPNNVNKDNNQCPKNNAQQPHYQSNATSYNIYHNVNQNNETNNQNYKKNVIIELNIDIRLIKITTIENIIIMIKIILIRKEREPMKMHIMRNIA